MEPIEVQSSNVGFIHYDVESEILKVAFNDGYKDSDWDSCRGYAYFDVPSEVFEALRDAESKGAFIHCHIAFEYRYEHSE
jgi:hypothetical protein